MSAVIIGRAQAVLGARSAGTRRLCDTAGANIDTQHTLESMGRTQNPGQHAFAASCTSRPGEAFLLGGRQRLRCFASAWPFLETPPLPADLARPSGPDRQCDARPEDFSLGKWTRSAGRSAHTAAYLAALHNSTAWKAVEGGREAHGRHGYFSRCHCKLGVCHSERVLDWSFTPHTGCSRLGVAEAVARLRSRTLTILGDSTTIQHWSSLATVNAAGSQRHWPRQAVWFCLPSSFEQLDRLLRRAGLWRDAPAAADGSILLLSFGAWYNVNLEHVCGHDSHWNRTTEAQITTCFAAGQRRGGRKDGTCANLTGEFEPIPAALAALPEWQAEATACTSKPFAARSRGAPDPCLRGRGDLCRVRLASGSLDQCELSRSHARLAAFFSSHRAHLPEHVFVLDSPPTHGRAIFDRDNGRWRTRTRAIWQLFAPWVTVLPSSEVLVPHVRSATIDQQHWCVDTSQFAEYLRSVLTAIVSVAEGRRWRAG